MHSDMSPYYDYVHLVLCQSVYVLWDAQTSWYLTLLLLVGCIIWSCSFAEWATTTVIAISLPCRCMYSYPAGACIHTLQVHVLIPCRCIYSLFIIYTHQIIAISLPCRCMYSYPAGACIHTLQVHVLIPCRCIYSLFIIYTHQIIDAV